MVARSNYREIDQRAAEWAARYDAGSLTPSEQTELETWLAADARHMGAYAKAEAVLCQLERTGTAGAMSLRQRLAPERLTRRGLILTGSVAASLGVLLPGSYFDVPIAIGYANSARAWAGMHEPWSVE